jgi:nitroimidazol reductase NimA-like FMN-containing flavoprotein (pyridoxamine 5'-phosphate oxidase superfamily)
MSVAIPSLPQYAFMAWCSVKAQGQLYLLLHTEEAKYLFRKYKNRAHREKRLILHKKMGSNKLPDIRQYKLE